MNPHQIAAFAEPWLTRLLRRKAAPRRLETDEAQADEIDAMIRAIVRHIPRDATADEVTGWLETVQGEIDLAAAPTWPSIGDVVTAIKRAVPAREVERVDSDERHRAKALEWLKTDQARPAFLEGWHVAGAQWVQRTGRFPTEREREDIRLGSQDTTEQMLRSLSEVKADMLAKAIMRAACGIERRRRGLYAKFKAFHRLPESPDWEIDLEAVERAAA